MRVLWKQVYKIRFWLMAGLTLALLNAASDLFLPTVMAKIVDEGVAKGDIAYLKHETVIMLIAAGCAVVIKYGKNICAIKSGNGYARNQRQALFEHIMRFSPADAETFGAASLITRATSDVTQVSNIIDTFVRMMVRIPITCIGGLVLTFALDPEMAWVILAVVPLIFLISIRAFMSTLPHFSRIQTLLDKLSTLLRENLSGIRVVRAFNREKYEEKRIDETNGALADTTMAAEMTLEALNPLMTLLVNLTVVALVAFAILRSGSGGTKIGVLIACIQYANQILSSVVQTSMLFSRIPRAAVSIRRIAEVMEKEPSVLDGLKGEEDLRRTEGEEIVRFEHVSYYFPKGKEDTVHDLSFSLEKGKTTAIIGSTGAGKTTIVRLLERFFDVTGGRILFKGEDIRDLSQKALRDRIAPVLQKAYLFSGSLAYNLQMGSEGTEAEMEEALEIAQAREFTDAFPEGLEHRLAAGGNDLSGGQKQRLTIARALMRKADLYIFDDSFSALDFATDARLRAALRPRLKDAAVLIIAQRVSTIRDADTILVMDAGRLIASGTHDELMASSGVYREIASSQGFGGDEI